MAAGAHAGEYLVNHPRAGAAPLAKSSERPLRGVDFVAVSAGS